MKKLSIPDIRPGQQLSQRADVVQDSKKVAAVSRMLGLLGHKGSEPQVIASGYVYATQGQSLEDIETAAERFMAGKVEGQNKAFPPTSAEFAAEVRRLAEPKPDELARQRINETQAIIARYAPPSKPNTDPEISVPAMAEKYRREREQHLIDEKQNRLAKQHAEIDARISANIADSGQAASDPETLMQSLENLRRSTVK